MAGCGERGSIGRRRLVIERRMRPCGVVVGNPSNDDFPSLIEIKKQALVEKLITHTPVEGFDVAVLHRLAGCDVVPFHPMLFAPAQDRVRGELGAVVRHDHPRLASRSDERREFPGDPIAGDRGVGDRREALPRHVVDNIENAEAAAAGELIVDKVERPAGVGLGLDKDRRPCSYRLTATSAFAHRQSLLAIEPVDAIDAGWLALISQQDEESAIAEPAPLVGEIAQTDAQPGIGWPTRAIADHLAIGRNDAAGPPLAHLQHATQMSHSLALGDGPYHFFDRSSFRAALSSIDSANNFFSFRFSSSSVLSRLASDTSR